MLGLSELTSNIWNELMLPNNIKKDWVNITNNRYITAVSKYPWLGADILIQNDIRLTELINVIQDFNFPWINDMRNYLKNWKEENDKLIKAMPTKI